MTEATRRKHRMREVARTRHLRRLIREQRGRCYWCQQPIASHAATRDAGRLVRATGRNLYLTNGAIVALATIDHLLGVDLARRRECNAREALAAACSSCNQGREAANRHGRPFVPPDRRSVPPGHR